MKKEINNNTIQDDLLNKLIQGTYNKDWLDNVPNEFAIESTKQILDIFKLKNIIPSNLLPSFEGGVMIEFLIYGKYNCIDIYNEGVITLVKNIDFKIEEIKLDKLLIELNQIEPLNN